MRDLLKRKNIRSTPFREEVMDVFLKHPQAINMQTIEGHLGKFDRITLYRTLKTFEESGVIHEIAISGDDKHWALCMDNCHQQVPEHVHEHIHLHCKKCQEVFCVPVKQLPVIEVDGFVIEQMDINVKGYCTHCLA